MRIRSLIAGFIALACTLFVTFASAAPPAIPAPAFTDPLRGTTPLDQESSPPLIAPTENKDVIRQRAYAQQPPTIPHKIDGYQLDRTRIAACPAMRRAGPRRVTRRRSAFRTTPIATASNSVTWRRAATSARSATCRKPILRRSSAIPSRRSAT